MENETPEQDRMGQVRLVDESHVLDEVADRGLDGRVEGPVGRVVLVNRVERQGLIIDYDRL